MKNALLKDFVREIKSTLNRFISILLIVALGVAFFAGVRVTGLDMQKTGDKYCDDNNLMDLRILTTYGLNSKDIDAVKKVNGVKEIMPAYSADMVLSSAENEYVVKVLSLPSNINKTVLVEGRMPENENECVIDNGVIRANNKLYNIGDKITLQSGTLDDMKDTLEVSEYTIVGSVNTPYYLTLDREVSSIGTGNVDFFIMVSPDNFNLEVYTEAYVTIDDVQQLNCFKDIYKDQVDIVANRIEDMANSQAEIRLKDIIKEANKKLARAESKLNASKKEAETKLADAKAKIEDGKKELEDGKKKLQQEKQKFNTEVEKAQIKIANAKEDLKKAEKEIQSQEKTLNQSEKKLSAAEKHFAMGYKQLLAKESESNQMIHNINANSDMSPTEKEFALTQLYAGLDNIAAAKQDMALQKKELVKQRTALENGKKLLADAKKTLSSGKRELAKQKKILNTSMIDVPKEFEKAEKKLTDGEKTLNKNIKKYEDAVTESDDKISKAEQKIKKSKNDIEKLEKPEWFVLDRDTIESYADFGQNTMRIEAIGVIFPLIFFLVAALVSLTTMTRMVEEQRMQIGTLKALGYHKAAIASKYILYAFLASTIGSIIGLIVGQKLLPVIIFNAYKMMYPVMPSVMNDLDLYYSITSSSLAIFCTLGATLFACYGELKSPAAMLMRPVPPKNGRRVFIENLPFIWKRLNFTNKVTIRNLIRYKKRFYMTVLGISGCTALLITGFGLKNSISDIVDKQFNEIFLHQIQIDIDTKVTKDDIKELQNFIKNDHRILDGIYLRQTLSDISFHDVKRTAYVIVPSDTDTFSKYLVLKDRKTQKHYALDESGIIITEKLAKLLGASVGDEISISISKTKNYKAKIVHIAENYMFHYIYITPKLYEKLSGKTFVANQFRGNISNTSEEFKEQLKKDALGYDAASTITMKTSASKDFSKMVGSLDIVLLVLIVSAGLLAFIVLYNLNNININERKRELATIKVLGFYDNEVAEYVYRENIMLTIIGTIVGLVFGVFLHRFVILTAEVDMIMFGRNIQLLSYVYSAIYTMIFSIFVNYIMFFKLKKINMVESLKSVE